MSDRLGLGAREFEILATLVSRPRHGYGIMAELRETGTGDRILGPGTLYRVLKGLVERGLITAALVEESSDGPPRRYYRLTALGQRAVSTEGRRLAEILRRVEPLIRAEIV